jgi:hypothetical protein
VLVAWKKVLAENNLNPDNDTSVYRSGILCVVSWESGRHFLTTLNPTTNLHRSLLQMSLDPEVDWWVKLENAREKVRSAMLIYASFLPPFSPVFVFIYDTFLVKILGESEITAEFKAERVPIFVRIQE